MLRNFLKFEWLSLKRSASFKMNLVLKIILGIAGLFYGGLTLVLGAGVYYLMLDEGYEPFETINSILIYWWATDLVFRYFVQKIPVTWVRPFLGLPISKRKLTFYLLGKSAFSFFNIYPSFFFLPFSLVLMANGYSIIGVLTWHLAIFLLTFINNYLNLTMNNKEWFLGVIIGVAALGFGLYFFNIFDILGFFQGVFDGFYSSPLTVLVPIALFAVIFYYNYHYFYASLYLDDAIKIRKKDAKIQNYSWLERFGLMGTFLKNDLRLILRNKRSKNTLFMSVFFLFYGLLIFLDPRYDNAFWLILGGMFVPSGFLFMFGGFVPSWDSAYYQFMMSQNIKYRDYLASKWWLMVVATIVSTILSAFYLFLGTKYYIAILVGGIYNIGVNSYLTLLAGAFVKTPIDLSTSKKPFGDKQSLNFKTILLGLPKVFLPVLIFYSVRFSSGETAGFIAIALVGVLGLVFRNFVFDRIEEVYKKEKYSTIQAYKQKN